jgi:enediyne biosynthesis protein E4
VTAASRAGAVSWVPWIVAFSPLLWPSARGAADTPAAYQGPVFEDVTRRSGLTVSHISTPDKRYIVESMSGGVGMLDCDDDGRLDLVVVNGGSVERYRAGGDPLVTLYHQEPRAQHRSHAGESGRADDTRAPSHSISLPLRGEGWGGGSMNDTAGSFRDVSAAAGLARRGWGMGVAVADYDNDGRLDLYVTGYGGNALYRGLGRCTFEDVTEKAGLRASGFSTGAAWADYDRDGLVDLFVSRYVHVDMQALPEIGKDKFCVYRGIPVQCGPWGMTGEGDFLFRNRGDGTFEDVSARARVADTQGRYGMGVVWGDYDDDGWPDLFVANDAGENYLYHNNHDGTFSDRALALGVALSGDGVPLGNMGVDFGDYDRDGRLDIFDTTFENQDDTLYRNQGSEGFLDVSRKTGVGQPSAKLVKWGTGFVDFDNDGWLDLFVASGHVLPQVDQSREGYRYRQPLLLHMNQHDGTFAEQSLAAALRALPPASRRGAAFGDIDNDGRMDVLLLNAGELPTLLRNRLASGNHWIGLALVGTKSNRAAIGARVTVRAGDATQVAEVRGGSSYLSQNDLRLHFGLGSATRVVSVDVAWPSGRRDHWSGLDGDRYHTLTEGSGAP